MKKEWGVFPRRMYLLSTSIPMSRTSRAAARPLAVSDLVRSHTGNKKKDVESNLK
jgi:hypothetical protein